MATTRQILGLGLGGLLAYLVFRRKSAIDAANAAAGQGVPAAALAASIVGSGVATATPVTPGATTQQLIGKIGGAATAAAGSINPVAGAIVGGATAIAGVISSFFSSTPPEPVIRLLVTEIPHAGWQAGNIPPGATIYALDAFGYLHEVGGVQDLGPAGYLDREVVAVNWKVFAMMPIAGGISHASELEATRMPRPADARTLRGVLGNDIIFYLGRDTNAHGPWDRDANVEPYPGSPAMWAGFAGSYVPTVTASAGAYW
jgi:hypothetical protein